MQMIYRKLVIKLYYYYYYIFFTCKMGKIIFLKKKVRILDTSEHFPATRGKKVHCRSYLIPEVSGQVPCIRPNMFPQALLTAAILARTGKLWMTKDTSVRCCRARFWAWPRIPNPVMSVAACALKVCISPAAGRRETDKCQTFAYLWAALMWHALTCSVESSHV